jgi:CRP/FNR family transcriptional regulator, anaerobic regulatory protein
MAQAARSSPPGGPAIRAADPWLPRNPSAGKLQQLLSDEERAQLATIASIVRFKKGEKIYSDGEPAEAIFNIISGIVKAYKTARDGSEHIAAFLYPQDLFGLSEEGRYTNSAKALTPVTAYSLPTAALRRRLSKDAGLEFHVIAKLCHELRQAQHHALLLAQKHALSKLAIFLQLQEHLQAVRGESTAEIYLPMDRSNIAEYVGMSLAAVSRGFRTLVTRRIVKVRDRRHVTIINREAFEKLAADANDRSGTRSTTK